MALQSRRSHRQKRRTSAHRNMYILIASTLLTYQYCVYILKKKVISGIVIFILKIGQFYFYVHEHIRALSYWHILKA